MKVRWSEEFVKNIKKIDKITAKRIIEKIVLISDNPYPFMEKIVTRNLWRVRVGDYRVIVKIEKDTIYVVTVGHRKNIYKKL